MSAYIFTFPVGGPLRDNFMRVEADDEIAARLAVIEVHGRDGWAGCYSEDAGMATVAKYGLTEIAWVGAR